MTGFQLPANITMTEPVTVAVVTAEAARELTDRITAHVEQAWELIKQAYTTPRVPQMVWPYSRWFGGLICGYGGWPGGGACH